MSANLAGNTVTGRRWPAAPGAPSTTRGPTVGVAPPTARAEQDLVDQGYGEAGRDFLAETQLPEDVTAVVTNPPDGRRLFEFVDRALELTRLVGGTVAILGNGNDSFHQFTHGLGLGEQPFFDWLGAPLKNPCSRYVVGNRFLWLCRGQEHRQKWKDEVPASGH